MPVRMTQRKAVSLTLTRKEYINEREDEELQAHLDPQHSSPCLENYSGHAMTFGVRPVQHSLS